MSEDTLYNALQRYRQELKSFDGGEDAMRQFNSLSIKDRLELLFHMFQHHMLSVDTALQEAGIDDGAEHVSIVGRN